MNTIKRLIALTVRVQLFLKGKKTYIIAAIAFLAASEPILLQWIDGNLTLLVALQDMWTVAILPLLASTLRAGIAKK